MPEWLEITLNILKILISNTLLSTQTYLTNRITGMDLENVQTIAEKVLLNFSQVEKTHRNVGDECDPQVCPNRLNDRNVESEVILTSPHHIVSL